MKDLLPSWWPVMLPVISSGAIVGCAALLMLGPWAGVFAFVACAATAVSIFATVLRQERIALAKLRNPELRHSPRHHAGIYQSFFNEVLRHIDQLEAGTREALSAKTQTAALLHVRQRQAQRLESAFVSLAEPLLITDACDEIIFCNPAAAQLWPQGEETALTGSGDSLPELAQIPALRDLVTEARSKSARSRSVEFELPVGTGAPRAFRATATNIIDSDQDSVGTVVVLQDLSRENAEKARHAEFVSSASHELKTPLASMRAFVEMLIDGDVTEHEEQVELYGFLEVQIDRLTRLINNMLNLARIESGVIKVQRQDCGLNEVLQHSLETVQPMAEEKGISLISELSELYLPVFVDPDLFGQAIINLLSNAVKYTPTQGTVRLRSRMLEEEAVIEVRDSGMGIPAESLPHLFERFYRVPENNGAAAGTGLGLSLVHYIVTAVHNGRITVDSKVNEGSCFSVFIPLGHRQLRRKKQEPLSCTA